MGSEGWYEVGIFNSGDLRVKGVALKVEAQREGDRAGDMVQGQSACLASPGL